jgi:hypothetical protein
MLGVETVVTEATEGVSRLTPVEGSLFMIRTFTCSARRQRAKIRYCLVA